ncbi:MAG: acyl carrier protein [Epulopiscium sp. Nele67-Bin004]|nr:MAG: acyl carrier protein [Epulopiscium sp. Nele67-Bin004]
MILEKLQEIIAEKLGIEEAEVTLESDFKDDLDADSLDLFEIIMALEEEFGVSIANDDVEKIKTVEDAVKYIEERQ